MSGRVLQKLREDREKAEKEVDATEEEESEDEVETRPSGAFLGMMDDSSSDEEESEDEESEDLIDKDIALEAAGVEKDPESMLDSAAAKPVDEDDLLEKEEEDLDAILAEFQDDEEDMKVAATKTELCCFTEISAGLDARNLDYESVMRKMLLGVGSEEAASAPSTSRRRQAFLFGPARNGWVRPPHYVGGGIGMTSYDQHPQSLPWPYQEISDQEQVEEIPATTETKNWFTFMHSDTYKKDLESYREIQQSGDVDALALFVADNPFVPEAILQLAKVVYQTNNSQEALMLLRRVVWIHECAALKSFAPHSLTNNCFVDFNQKENKTFFNALFLLTQVSSIAGCMHSSLAISRYLLAMDPLRDPMGVLLALDHFALSLRSVEHDSFVINFVERCGVHLHYRDEEKREFKGAVTDMPNWAYSYALALYRLERADDESVIGPIVTSTDALVSAIQKYPTIVEELLKKNDISTSGRSTQTDWPSVLESLRKLAYPPSQHPEYDPIIYHATKSASDLIAKIFVQRSFNLWGSHDVQKWLYDAAVKAAASGDNYTAELPSPALQRYARSDPANYEDRFRLLPAEANPLDLGLLQFALNMDPNRRRLLRRGNRAGVAEIDPLEALENRARAGNQGIVIGGPPTHNLDPDSPLVELLWQSMLPWNRVEGIPPPPR